MIVEDNSKESETRFVISGAKFALAKLRQAFVTAPILQHFNLECHIQIKTHTLDYAIGGIFSQLTLNNSDR